MGTLVRIEGDRPVLLQRERRGAAVEVFRGGLRTLSYLCRLELSPLTPLSEYTPGFEELTPCALAARTGRRRRTDAAAPPETELQLQAGVWALGTRRPSYLAVGLEAEVSVVSRPRAFCLLGAVPALQALGLDDAAVSLAAGSYDFAALQWLERGGERR